MAAVLASRRPRYTPNSANPPPTAATARSNMAAGRARPRTQSAGERAGNARLRAGREEPPRAPRVSPRRPGPAPFRRRRAPRGRTGAAVRERVPPPLASALGCSGLAAAAAGREGWFPPRSCGPLLYTRTPLRGARAAPARLSLLGRGRGTSLRSGTRRRATAAGKALPGAPRPSRFRWEPQVPGLPSTLPRLRCPSGGALRPRPGLRASLLLVLQN